MAFTLKKMIFLSVAALLLWTAPASAQTPHGEFYKATPKSVSIALARRPDLDGERFVLRLSAENAVTGCPKLGNLEYQVKFYSNFMDVMVQDYSVDFRDLPDNPQYTCANRAGVPTADIILGRDMLREMGTTKILFRLGNIVNYYDVHMTNELIRITPGPEQAIQPGIFKPLNVEYAHNTLQHYFYPEGTVILNAASVPPGTQGIRQAIDRLAYQNGLVPLESLLPGFSTPLRDSTGFYYVDRNRQVVDRIPPGQVASVGNISTEMKVYGLHGDEYVARTIGISARKPGMFE